MRVAPEPRAEQKELTKAHGASSLFFELGKLHLHHAADATEVESATSDKQAATGVTHVLHLRG